MLEQQQKFILSPYMAIYDIVVSKENVLRRINELIDFSFVYVEHINKYCLGNGRNAISPIRMFKYLLLKSMFDLSDGDIALEKGIIKSKSIIVDATHIKARYNQKSPREILQ